MIADEIHKIAKGSQILNKMFTEAIINVMDGMFEQLEEGRPPLYIEGLKNCDQEEVITFLCTYHKIKMEQERTK
ncbi:hypothetical protein [Escherichia phage KW1E_UTAR]|nr:hypothetical protein [Escherichia phage KW1E_UTAR]